ncbi:unnamed protein product, partial [Prorocentrum cordatum]
MFLEPGSFSWSSSAGWAGRSLLRRRRRRPEPRGPCAAVAGSRPRPPDGGAMKLSSSPSPGRRAAPRVLRVEYNGMPYDWLNLDEMGPRVAHSEQFIATLRDNIVRYFKVP